MMEVLWLSGIMAANLGTPILAGQSVCGVTEERPTSRILACWDRNVGSSGGVAGLSGTVCVFSEETDRPIEAEGTIVVEAYDMLPVMKGGRPRRCATWTFDADSLKKLKRRLLMGDGYAIFLPWEEETNANVKHLKLRLVYTPKDASAAPDDTAYLELRTTKPAVVAQAAFIEAAPKVVHAHTVSNARSAPAPGNADVGSFTVKDIVRLSKAGINKDIILRQVEVEAYAAMLKALCTAQGMPMQTAIQQFSFGAVWLTADDLIHMKEQGVTDDVVRALQDRLLAILSHRLASI